MKFVEGGVRLVEFSKRYHLYAFILASILADMDTLVRWFEHANIPSAREMALGSDRPLFVDLFAPQCKECDLLEDVTYRDSRIIALLNERFVPVRCNAKQADENYNLAVG
jgi:hypothetical protein